MNADAEETQNIGQSNAGNINQGVQLGNIHEDVSKYFIRIEYELGNVKFLIPSWLAYPIVVGVKITKAVYKRPIDIFLVAKDYQLPRKPSG